MGGAEVAIADVKAAESVWYRGPLPVLPRHAPRFIASSSSMAPASAKRLAPASEVTYTISALAHEFALTTRAIRFYEDEGMLSPERRGRSRVYRERERVRLRLILRGK